MDNQNKQIEPYGGKLCDLVLSQDAAENLKIEAANYPSVTLTQSQICDLELLMNSAYRPLTEFMCKDEYDFVVHK